MNERWDRRFLELAESISRWSKDPSRGVGAVIVSPARQILSTGFNGIPRGVEDLPERLERPAKYDLICHAELNAIVQCARNAVSPVGCTLYSTFSPCIQCGLAIIQSGLTRVVSYQSTPGDEAWAESIRKAEAIFRESGIEYRLYARTVS